MSIRNVQVGDHIAGHIITHIIDSNSGFGNIYRARHQSLNTDRAIKQLRPNRLAYREMFIEEARRANRINDPHVVKIHHLIEGDPTYGDLIIMDWIEGETLLRWRHHQDDVSPHQFIHIARGIAQGLAAVHAFFSHNDIKPDNIMVRPDLQPILIDFGLAYHDGDGRMHPVNRGAKTAAFAAPEVLQNKVLQNEGRLLSDIFSLGVVYYYLFTGKHYLNMTMSQIAANSSTQFILENLIHSRPIPIQNCPPSLNDLIMQMLNPIPAQRPPTLKSVIDQLDAITLERQQAIQTHHEQNLAHVPQIYVGIPDVMKINTEAIPMNPINTKTGRILYQAPIAPSPLADTLLLAVQYQQSLYTATVPNPNKIQSLYFGEDARGHLQLMYNDQVLPLLTMRPHIPPNVHLTRQCKTQLAVILDGRIVGEALNIISFIVRTLQESAENNYELEVAIILYGAYPELKDAGKSKWTSPYYLQAQDFHPYPEAIRFAEYYLYDTMPDFSGIGLSGSLEVALHHTLHKLSWDKHCAHYALVLGHGAPYPTPKERRDGDLFEFSIDEFIVNSSITDWHKTRDDMRQSGITMNAAYIEPPYGISQAYRTFMTEAWSSLDEDRRFHHIHDGFTAENFCKVAIQQLQRIKHVVHLPQKPYPLPLSKPLA